MFIAVRGAGSGLKRHIRKKSGGRTVNQSQTEQRRTALYRSGGVCEVCGKVLTVMQGAHRIANTKSNRAKFGSLVIDHPLNIAIVCSLKCNDACNIGYNPRKSLELAQKIYGYELKRMGGVN